MSEREWRWGSGCRSLEKGKIYTESHLPLQEATAVIESKRCNYLSKEDITHCVCVYMRAHGCVCVCLTSSQQGRWEGECADISLLWNHSRAGENTRVLPYSLQIINSENLTDSLNQRSHYLTLLLVYLLLCVCLYAFDTMVSTAAIALQAQHTNVAQAILELVEINIFYSKLLWEG